MQTFYIFPFWFSICLSVWRPVGLSYCLLLSFSLLVTLSFLFVICSLLWTVCLCYNIDVNKIYLFKLRHFCCLSITLEKHFCLLNLNSWNFSMNIQSVLEFILRKQRNSHTFIFFKLFKNKKQKCVCKYNIYIIHI